MKKGGALKMQDKSQLMIDFLEIREQINEYTTELQNTVDQDHEAVEIPHYNQIKQMISHFQQLTQHALQRSEDQINTIQELSQLKADFEQQTYSSNAQINSLEIEIKNHERKISNLKIEQAQSEQDYKGCSEELAAANEAINKYKDLNDDLCMKIEQLQRQEKDVQVQGNEQSSKLAESFKNITMLQKKQFESEASIVKQKQEIEKLKSDNEIWEQRTKDLFSEIKQRDLYFEQMELERQMKMGQIQEVLLQKEQSISELSDIVKRYEEEENLREQSKKGIQPAGVFAGLSFIDAEKQMSSGSPDKIGQANEEQPESGATKNHREDDDDDKGTEAVKGREEADQPVVVVEDEDNALEGVEDELQGIGDDAMQGEGDTFLMADPDTFEQMGGTSAPGSFIEPSNLEDDDEPNRRQSVLNAEDEFKTSEHNSDDGIDVEPITIQTSETAADKAKGNDIKGQPTSHDPLSAGLTPGDISQETEDNVIAELRRDPQEEFFKLAILSLKMIHTEKEEAEYIYEISSEKLFQQVKQLKVPFHRWYQWLETRFAHLKQAHDEEMLKESGSKSARAPIRNEEEPFVTVNMPKDSEDATPPSRSSLMGQGGKNAVGGFGIFDKIYNYLNRQNKEEKEQMERKQKEDRLLSGPGTGVNTIGSLQPYKSTPYQQWGNTQNPYQKTTQSNAEFMNKYKNYQKMDEIQKLNMPSPFQQSSYQRFGAQGPLKNPLFSGQGPSSMTLSTKTEEILQRSQLKMPPRQPLGPLASPKVMSQRAKAQDALKDTNPPENKDQIPDKKDDVKEDQQ